MLAQRGALDALLDGCCRAICSFLPPASKAPGEACRRLVRGRGGDRRERGPSAWRATELGPWLPRLPWAGAPGSPLLRAIRLQSHPGVAELFRRPDRAASSNWSAAGRKDTVGY